jgi:hypothetical protein
MRFFNLRIAWSVAWGVVAVLLCVLWVRSYWHCDILNTSVPELPRCLLASVNGELRIEIKKSAEPEPEFRFHRSSAGAISDPDRFVPKHFTGFRLPVSQLRPIPIVPHWFAASVAGVIAITGVGRTRFQFSLRALLIATTLVAVVLVLMVWSIK